MRDLSRANAQLPMTMPESTPPEPPETKNARLWLESVDPDLSPEERLQVNSQITDALTLMAAIGYHVGMIELQADCAVYDQEQGRQETATQRLAWIREAADMALQCFHDMLRLTYETEEEGGPAGKELGPELKKSARLLLSLAQAATARTGQEIDLFSLRIAGHRQIPGNYQPGDAVPDLNSPDLKN